MTSTINRAPNGTITLTITIPWADVEKAYEATVDKYVENAELPGFRKGKAPKKLVEEKVDKTKAYEDMLKDLLPKVYGEAVQAQKIHPIVTPKVELSQAEEGKDWIIKAHTCEKPEIKLGNYKKAIQEVKTAKGKKIWLPGEEPKKEEEEKDNKPALSEILEALYKNVTVDLPELLIEQEVNRLLSDLLDQIRKLGLTVDQYLASSGKTSESLKAEFTEQAKHTLTLELALEAIGDEEGILVGDDDIDAIIKTAKTEDEKKALSAQRYYIASVLRRQKTLDFLTAL